MAGRTEGWYVDAVLGLSVTPSAVGLVLVEGRDADGATVDREAFDIPTGDAGTALCTSDQAAAAVLRTEAIAASNGRRLHSIGVTWSDDADSEASLLLRSLTDRGFDNVVPVGLPEASEALAWGIADVIGHDITAVCVIEPDTVIALVVHGPQGAVQTAVNHSIDNEEALLHWLSAVFTGADWQPEALVVVGTGGDLNRLMPKLEDVLSVPVYAPAEAELALARGAALVSAHHTEPLVADDVSHAAHRRRRDRRRPVGQAAPLALLAAGAVTFVASVSVAIGTQFTPERNTAPIEPRQAANVAPEAAAAANPLPAAVPAAPAVQTPLAPPPVPAAPVEASEPPAAVDIADTAPVVDAPAVAPLPPAPPVAPAPPVEALPVEALPPGAAYPPAPGLVPVEPTPRPEERPGILRRIKDRLSRIGDNNEPQQAPAPAVAPPADQVPPPAPPPLPPPGPQPLPPPG